jgi:hypothetical protein
MAQPHYHFLNYLNHQRKLVQYNHCVQNLQILQLSCLQSFSHPQLFAIASSVINKLPINIACAIIWRKRICKVLTEAIGAAAIGAAVAIAAIF